MAKEVKVKGFDDTYALHIGKNPITILEVTEIVHNLQKKNPSDESDKYGLSPEDYEIKREGMEDALEIDHIVEDGDELILCAKQY